MHKRLLIGLETSLTFDAFGNLARLLLARTRTRLSAALPGRADIRQQAEIDAIDPKANNARVRRIVRC